MKAITTLLSFVYFLGILQTPSWAQRPTNREAMWPAPTAEEWKRPCLIRWERTWADAVAVSKQTKKPILVCVNMDGEIASEHYAGVRYRQKETAELYKPYVCVIASVYRHNIRDFDEEGRRIPCPRFGTVTCGEHIAIEPLIFQKFLDSKRIAPRHIMVELDGKESYDIYYALDTASVFDAIHKGITLRKIQAKPDPKGDRSITERVKSRAGRDREAVERAFLQGDRRMKKALLVEALKNPDADPSGLLRLAIFGFDEELASLARKALAKSTREGAAEVIHEALRGRMKPEERATLLAALERLSQFSTKARRYAMVHRGLEAGSKVVDLGRWTKGLAGASYKPASPKLFEIGENAAKAKSKLKKGGKDPEALLNLAFSRLELALGARKHRPLRRGRGPSQANLLFQDALDAAQKAGDLGAQGWKLFSVLALGEMAEGNRREALVQSEKAVAALPPGETHFVSAQVLHLFARLRRDAIVDAHRAKKPWPSGWLTDMDSAYSVLEKHPQGTATQLVEHLDVLLWLDVKGRAARAFKRGLARFPSSWLLHDRLRGFLLKTRGVKGLEAWYQRRLEDPKKGEVHMPWFAGYASIVAAEFHRRGRHPELAKAAYDRALGFFQKSAQELIETRESSEHYSAVALAGKARVLLEQGYLETATEAILTSFQKKPNAAATRDGLNLSAVDTARMLLRSLKDQKMDSLSSLLQKSLSELPSEVLELPAFERRVGPSIRSRRRKR
jgi:tetratricopeptide (TPR) repeat protein